MCTHSRWIFNSYNRRKILVPCGKCEACQQEKACARSNRIRNNVTPGTIALFITLTYTNDFVPYISRQSLYDSDEVTILRRCSGRFVFNRHDKKLSFKKSPGISIVSKKGLEHPLKHSSISKYKHLNGLSRDHIGVCYYPDLQNFFKRLRIILKRKYNYERQFSFYACSELGGSTKRPHFHALIFIGKDDEEKFRCAILEAWPFADCYRTREYIEIARDAASYVSSYVNSNTRVLSLFKENDFRPKHSYSKNFGVVLDCFSLSSLLEKLDRRDLQYYRKSKYDGETDVSPVPIPKYVINRYFPQFKGLCRLPLLQLFNVLRDPSSIGYVLRDSTVNMRYFMPHDKYYGVYDLSFNTSPGVDCPLYHYSNKEAYRIFVRLENAYLYFHRVTGLNRFDYARCYIDMWHLYFTTILEDSFKDIETTRDYAEHYDNAVLVEPAGACHLRRRWLFHHFCPTLSPDIPLNPDYNERSWVRSRSVDFKQLFYKLDKEKKVINYSMASQGHFV